MAELVVLDSSALVSFVLNQPAAPQVAELLRENKTGVTRLHLAESLDVLMRVYRVPEIRLNDAISPLLGKLVTLLPIETSHSWRAAKLRNAHYTRSQTPLSLADVMLLAVSKDHAGLTTSDQHVIDVAQAESIDVVALPSSADRLAEH